MEVTIAAPLITITKSDGVDVNINGNEVVNVSGFEATVYNRAPYAPTVAPPNDDTGIGLESTSRFGVTILLSNGRKEQFFLDQVTNQVTWTNNTAGVNNAVTAISAAL